MRYTISSTGQITGASVVPLTGIPAVLTFVDGIATLEEGEIIPLKPIASQQFDITLNNQACTILLYFKNMWIPASTVGQIPTEPPALEELNVCFMDLYVDSKIVVGGVRCSDRNVIVRDAYFGFSGDFSFIDTQGTDDPQISGLGSRWILTYWRNML